ncbi:MAG: GYF domain-containing protein [Planctomycetia bacterium]|nr:GYF domain-containing protein [Planctomycetia bacterium]
MAMYTRIRGKIHGPFDESQIQEMIQNGRIGRFNDVSEDGKTWIKASEIPDLFPARHSASRSSSQNDLTLNEASAAKPEDQQWFLSNDGITGTGPFSMREIKAMAAAGKANPATTLVWRQGENAQVLQSVPEYLDTGAAKNKTSEDDIPVAASVSSGKENIAGSSAEICPFCKKTVFTGTAFCPHCGKALPKKKNTNEIVGRCKECNTPLTGNMRICPRCGTVPVFADQVPKNRVVYILLALLFCGLFGAHNFYAKRKETALKQLLLTVTIVGSPITAIWCLVEAFTVSVDGDGVPMV